MWTIQLLGGLSVRGPQRSATRFRTRKTAALLAYLAFHCRDGAPPCPREVLVEMFWPEVDLEPGRHNLSNALSTLRHLLEPPGVSPGSVLVADRGSVRLNPGAVRTDVARFESLAQRCREPVVQENERAALVRAAAAEYGGRLLPGFYEEWITPEAERLAALFSRLTRETAPLLQARGEWELLLSCAMRAAADNPWCEVAARMLMEAQAAAGDPTRALRHYRELQRRLRDDLNAEPSPDLQQYAAELRRLRPGSVPSTETPSARQAKEKMPPSPAESVREEEGTLRGAAFAGLTVTRFFDREEEMQLLAELLQASRSRLVTLTGPGGTGKTRLALEAVRGLVHAEPLGLSRDEGRPTSVTFVPLAEVAEGARVPEVLLRSLGLTPRPGVDPLEQAADALARERAPLVVLDNFEHLVETGAVHVSSLLGRVPRMRCLVTSRQKLLIEGERELPLSPLSTVAADDTLEALAATPGIQLFVDRAQMARPDFQLTPRNAGVVAELCAHLEGLPLAVELAAARISLLSPSQILDGIHRDRLDFLASRRRDAVARQRSLRATLDWSYELLPQAARVFLAQLSVFRGGWTLEAAVAVANTGEEGTCLELLALLRDASLLHVQNLDEEVRFTLLETVREYAGERLAASGATEALRRRHADYFVEFAERQRALIRAPRHLEGIARLGRERENTRAAMEWAIEMQEHEHRARLADAMMHFWNMQGYGEQAATWFADVISAAVSGERHCVPISTLPPVLSTRLLLGLTALTGNIGIKAESEALCRWALAIADESGDPQSRAMARIAWARQPCHGGPDGTLAVLEEGLRLAREAEHHWAVALALNYKARLLPQLGELERAVEANREALALYRTLGDPIGIADVLRNQGVANLWYTGDLAAARPDLEENLALRRRLGDETGVATALIDLASLSRREGELEGARTQLQQALSILENNGWSRSTTRAHALLDLALTVWALGDARKAWEYSRRVVELMFGNRHSSGAAEGLEALAEQALHGGEPARAARLLGAAERVRPEGRLPEARRAKLSEQALRLGSLLGPETCQRELEAGRGLSDAQVLDLIADFPAQGESSGAAGKK